ETRCARNSLFQTNLHAPIDRISLAQRQRRAPDKIRFVRRNKTIITRESNLRVVRSRKGQSVVKPDCLQSRIDFVIAITTLGQYLQTPVDFGKSWNGELKLRHVSEPGAIPMRSASERFKLCLDPVATACGSDTAFRYNIARRDSASASRFALAITSSSSM